MKHSLSFLVAASLLASTTLTGCVGSRHGGTTERYVSSQVKGESAKINLDEVKTAFWDTKGKDFSDWMSAFEKRVNEIYEGKEVVSIDANRDSGKMTVTGFIDDGKEQGYQNGEEKLFTIEQTGDVSNNDLPYQISDHGGRQYYAGSHSILDSPFVQMMVLSHLMGGWGGRYYTPYNHTVILRDHRDSFRTTPGYTAQKTSNSDFHTRYKKNLSGGGFASSKGFGSSQSSSSKRSWGGFGSSSSSSSSRSVWGGRRSSGFGGGSRGWGGRRR